MRKNHHGKKDRLVKRVFALCLALAVICTCLVPVFATEGLIDPQVNQEASRPVDDGEASYPDDEFAGFGEEEATRPVDGGEAAGFGEDEVATRPVEGGEDNLDGGPTVKETEWGTVIEYDTSTSTSTDPSSSTETQWSGEDDVVEKPDDKVVVSGDEIKKLQDMVVYRFWLKELNTLDLQDITAQAQINNMTESEYLARNGEVLWNLYFIQAVPRAETIADYSSYIENPSSNRDPKGELRQFDYWYTLDEFGNRVRLNLTDPTSNILDDKTTTVNVYAAWKDGTVGSDEEESVDHEDLVDKNPVPVDLETKASASYEDEDGNTKSVNLPVEVKNLPSAADHLSVSHMGDNSMTEFCNTYKSELQGMQPLLGLKISPKNAKGETVQPANGQKATVTVSGLNELPDVAAMEEMGALTVDALKVLHKKDDGTVETLDVLTYTNGTLTFETSSFSPFVIALTGGYDVETLQIDKAITIQVGETRTLKATENTSGTWKIKNDSGNSNITLRVDGGNKATIYGNATGSATVTYSSKQRGISHTDKFKVNIEAGSTVPATIYNLLVPGTSPDTIAMSAWGWGIAGAQVDTSGIPWVSSTENVDIGVYTREPSGNKNLTNHITLPKNAAWVDRTDDAGKTVKAWKMPLTTQGYKWTQDKPDNWDTSTWHYDGDVDIVQQILDEYSSEIRKKNDWPVTWKLSQEDIAAVYLIPYKISKNNGTVGTGDNQIKDTHIDCVIQVDLKGYYTAEFYVQNTDTGAYELKNTKLYKHDESVLEFNGNSTAGLEKENYTFDGWYVENSTRNAPDFTRGKVDFVFTPSNELSPTDRVVKFYAQYVRNTQQLTVSKTVTGMLGDTNKAFTFQLKDAKGNAVAIDSTDDTAISTTGNATWTGTDGKFTLKHGDTITFNKLPVGTYYVYELDEEGALKHYQTTWTGADTEQTTPIEGGAERKATVTIGADGAKTLAFTNHCKLIPDTGVLLDTLPYIVILAVVAGGVALLMLRKHRKEDD